MKSKTIISGFLVLVILVGVAVFCLWLGYSIRENFSDVSSNDTQSESKSTENRANPDVSKQSQANGKTDVAENHLAFGNPSNATTNVANPNNYLLQNDYYAVSYNRDKGTPNWVAWQLTSKNIGDVERQNDFRPDERLPYGWPQVLPSDYNEKNYDRGHLCPSGDRTSSQRANSSTFLMTNMIPQTDELNQGPWEKLESYSRSLVRRSNVLYIYAGGYGELGKLKRKVTIPTNTWKIIVVLPKDTGVSQIDANTRIIAVDMPNVEGIKNANWREFKTTVRQIEQKTGYNFFANLPQNLQNIVETKVDSRQN